MARLLLLTNSSGASADVMPALGLLQHDVKILPIEASVLVEPPVVDCLLIDARRDLPAAKSFTKLITSTGVDVPIVVITTEGGLSAINADWGIDDVILDTAGPAEIEARIRIAIGRRDDANLASDPTAHEIRQGDVVIDENTYTAKIKGRSLDLTFKEFELLKHFAQHPGRVFTRDALLGEVWGYRHSTDTRLVNVHVQRLRSKVEHDPEHPQIIMTVRGVGYKAGVLGGS